MPKNIHITNKQFRSLLEGIGDPYNIKGVYHVSKENFEEFRNDIHFGYLFFSNKPIFLSGANNVYVCNLSMHKPLVFNDGMSWSYPLWLYLSDKDGHLIPEEEFTAEKYDGYLGCPYKLWQMVYYNDDEYSLDELPALVKELNMGYDGVIIKGIDEGDSSIMVDDYIVFDPSQVEIVKKYRK